MVGWMDGQTEIDEWTDSRDRRAEAIRRFDRLTNEVLPRLASEGEGWSVRFDHCFRRICLDCAVGGEWTEEIDRPATENMTEAQAVAALEVAAECIRTGPEGTSWRNGESLAYRRDS